MKGGFDVNLNEYVKVNVLATSDIHSHVLNGEFGSNIYRAGTYVKEVRHHNRNVLLLDSGGSLAGTLTAFYYAIVKPYKRHPMIKLMNALEYDASGISAKEFKFGLTYLNRSVALSRFPWLSANIEYRVTKEPYFSTPYTIKNFDGIKVAIVGLTSDGLMEKEYAEMVEDVKIEKTMFIAKQWLRYIHEKEEPDYMIVLYHGGLYKMRRHDTERERKINEAEKLMHQIGVIDLIITGNQHETTIGEDQGTVYVQAGQKAEHLIHVEILFKKRTNSIELVEVKPKIVDLNAYEEDETLLDLTYFDRKAVRHWSQEYVTMNHINFSVDDFDALFKSSHAFIQLLHKSMRRQFDRDITCVHVANSNVKGLSGKLTNEDIYNSYPHPDKPLDITISGQSILTMLEYAVSHIEENEAGKVELNHMDTTLFPFFEGVSYDVDLDKPMFNRVTLKNINVDHHYRISMTDYCYRNYAHLFQDHVIHEHGKKSMPELIKETLKSECFIVVE